MFRDRDFHLADVLLALALLSALLLGFGGHFPGF